MVFLPLAASAQLSQTRRIIASIGDLVKLLITVATAIALLAFIWGLAKFIFRIGGDEKAVDNGKALMKWGLIALFVLVSVWGIIGFIQGEFGLPRTANSPSAYPLPGSLNPQTGFPSQLPGQSVQLQPPNMYPQTGFPSNLPGSSVQLQPPSGGQ